MTKEYEPDCYGDGNVAYGMRSKDSKIKTILFSSNSEPARKPMNGDEVLEGFEATGLTNTDYRLRCFTEGVRFAEKYYGIEA